MNIFVTSSCPRESAEVLDDKRVIKMILESAQMLSTAMHVNGLNAPYKPTHKNHPCTIWTRTSKKNYLWLYDHFIALMEQYSSRYGKTHKCAMYKHIFVEAAEHMPDGELTAFPNCTPHKDMEVISAYRRTMKEKWQADKRKPTWKNNIKIIW